MGDRERTALQVRISWLLIVWIDAHQHFFFIYHGLKIFITQVAAWKKQRCRFRYVGRSYKLFLLLELWYRIFSLIFRSVLSQWESVEPHADHTTYSSKRLFIFQQWLEPTNLNTTIRLCFNLGSSPFSLRTSNSLFLNVLLPWRQIPKALYNVNCDRPRKRSVYANSGGVFFSSSQRWFVWPG